MIGALNIKHGVADHNIIFFVLTNELTAKRAIAYFEDDAFADPLPELGLRCPILFAVMAHY